MYDPAYDPWCTSHISIAVRLLERLQTAYTPGITLECWYPSSDGRVHGATSVYTKITQVCGLILNTLSCT
jgi:hypothetical protein